MDGEVLKEMEKALEENKTLEKLTLYYGGIFTQGVLSPHSVWH